MERIECSGIGWTINKGSETAVEGYSIWWRLKAVWREKAKESSKLEMAGKHMDNECQARCVGMDCKRRRRMMAKLIGGNRDWEVAWFEKRR